MDFTYGTIGVRVDESKRQFYVIVKQNGAWQKAGDTLSYPLASPPILATAKSASDIALLQLEIGAPSTFAKVMKVLSPH